MADESVSREEWDQLIKKLAESDGGKTEELLMLLPEVDEEKKAKEIRNKVREYNNNLKIL